MKLLRGDSTLKAKARLLAASISFGVLFAALLLFMGFDHNPQGEFFDPQSGAIDWKYAASLFAVWCMVGSLATAACFWVVLRAVTPRK